MATTKDVERLPSGKLKYRGEIFPGYNKPKRLSGESKKSAVLAKKGDEIKLFAMVILIWLSVKITLQHVKAFVLDTNVTQLKINLLQDTGPAKHGSQSINYQTQDTYRRKDGFF